MDPATILADAQIVLALGKLAIQVGEDAAPFIETAYDIIFNKRTLTDDERAAMLAREASLRATLQAPLPPEE
jgi:hypothetical protein